jgi:DNA-binding transcriptional ArsR family regulator
MIAAPVRYCKALPPASKLLYGELWALAGREGYCYAMNPYFMDLYDVDRRTVQRWLEALTKHGFIRVVYEPLTGERRIYPLADPTEGVGQKVHTPPTKMSTPPDRNAAQNRTSNNISNRTETLNVAVATPKATTQPPADTNAAEDAVAASQAVETSRAGETQINALLDMTGDTRSRRRFRQLFAICTEAGRLEDWNTARDQLRRRVALHSLDNPGAWFNATLAALLHAANVPVPTGSPRERKQVRDTIRASFAEAEQAQQQKRP